MPKLERLSNRETDKSDSIERAAQEELTRDELSLASGETARELGIITCETSPCQLCEHYREQREATVPYTGEALVSAHTEARESTTTTTVAGIDRVKQVRTEVQEARELLGILNTYVIPGMRNRDPSYNPKNATWVSVPPIIPVVKDPNSPFKHRPFSGVTVD